MSRAPIAAPRPPTAPEISERQLLASILDELRRSRQTDVPTDFTHIRSYPVSANSTSDIVVDSLTPYGYLYIPPQPVALTLYYGHGRGQPLGTVDAGQAAAAIIPHVDVLTVVPAANPSAWTLTVYPSTRPYRVDATTASGHLYAQTVAGAWIPARITTEGQLLVSPVTADNLGDGVVYSPAPVVDQAGAYHLLPAVPYLYNGASTDRARANQDIILLASAARTATTTTADMTNHNARGVVVVVDVTAVGVTPSVTVRIQGRDVASGKYQTYLTSAAISTVSTTTLTVYPGVTVAANTAASAPLPRVWRVDITHDNAVTITYSVGASLIL